jgi:hypothetical protein
MPCATSELFRDYLTAKPLAKAFITLELMFLKKELLQSFSPSLHYFWVLMLKTLSYSQPVPVTIE